MITTPSNSVIALTQLREHEKHFDRLRRNFFMIDLIPENETRFPLTFEECQRDPAEDPD